MTLRTKIIVSSLALVILSLLALNVMARRLVVTMLTQRLVPAIERKLDARITLGTVTVGMFGRSLRLSNVVAVKQDGAGDEPCLFIPAVSAQIKLWPLIHDTVHMTRLHIGNAKVTLTADSGILSVADPSSETPLELRLLLSVTAGDITSAPETSEEDWGDFDIAGHLQDDPESFVISIAGRIAPLAEPETPSFDMIGTIASIHPSDLGPAAERMNVQCKSADLDLDIVCRDGAYTPQSALNLTLTGTYLTGRLAERARHFPIPETLCFPVPLQGTFAEPELDVESALIETALRNLSGSLEAILDSTTIDGKRLDENIGKAARALGNVLKGWKRD